MHSSEPKPVAQYSITHGMWRHDYEVTGPQSFHVDNSSFRPGKPDLTFHAGPNNTAPITAICKFRNFSGDADIGLADPKQVDGMTWVCMNRPSLIKTEYGFRMDIGDHEPHHFIWKSTHAMGNGWAGNLKLVDETTQEVVAVFSTSRSLTKRKTGSLDLYVNYGERFQLLVLTTGLAVREKLRRTSQGSSIGVASSGIAASYGGINAFAGGGC